MLTCMQFLKSRSVEILQHFQRVALLLDCGLIGSDVELAQVQEVDMEHACINGAVFLLDGLDDLRRREEQLRVQLNLQHLCATCSD